MGLGSGKKPIPNPGSRGRKGTGSQIRIRNNVYKDPMNFSKCSSTYIKLSLVAVSLDKMVKPKKEMEWHVTGYLYLFLSVRRSPA